MIPKVITPPAPVLTMEQARLHLKYLPANQANAQDPILELNLAAAQRFAQSRTGYAIGEQTLQITLDAFPAGVIVLPMGPVTSIGSVKYRDNAGTLQTMNNTGYVLDDTATPATLRLAYGTSSWPATRAMPGAVTVEYVAGLGAGDVDPVVKQAMLLLLGHFDEHPAGVSASLAEVPLGITAMLDQVRDWS